MEKNDKCDRVKAGTIRNCALCEGTTKDRFKNCKHPLKGD